MKTFRFVIYICLFALCASMLGGCRLETGSTIGTHGRPPIIGDTEDPTQNASVTVQYLPAEVDNPENLPVLKWVCVTDMYYGGKNRIWSEEAVHELNQMLEDKEMPFRIQFVMLNNSDHTLYYDWAADSAVLEALQDADLIYADMTAAQMKEYFSPITAYASGGAEPSLENAVVHPLNWYQATVDGEIYAIPTIPTQATESGWTIGQEALDRFALQVNDFNAAFPEANDLLARLYAESGNKPFLSAGHEGVFRQLTTQYGIPDFCAPSIVGEMAIASLQTIGSCFVIDYSGDSPRVVHLMEHPQVREYQAAYMRHREAGYIVSDAEIPSVLFTSGSGFTSYTTVGGRLHIPAGTPIYSRTISGGRVTGIAASSEYKEQAASLLALIADDEEFRMQLFYGKQGRDYTVSEDGYYSIVKQEDGSCYSLDILSPYAYFSGLTSAMDNISYVSPGTNNWSLIEAEGYSAIEYYRKTLDRSNVCIPLTFDFSGLEDELASIQQLAEKYYPVFTNPDEIEDDPDTPENEYVPVMDEEGYEFVLQEFKKAGADTVIAELQRQLDAWLAANPDWDK